MSSKKRSSAKKKNRALPTVPGAPEASPRPAGFGPARKAGVVASWIGFALAALLCCLWVFAHAYLVDTVTVRLCEDADGTMPAARRMPVFLSEIAFDGYAWNRHAEKLGENGEWRLRRTDLDNAPDGRDVRWNSGFALYLRALGEIYRSRTGDSLRNSIFRMSIWANPILLVLTIVLFGTAAALRFGPLCGTVIVIGMVGAPSFYEGFMPAYPDHHGLIAFTLLGLVFGLAWAGAGWVQTREGAGFAPPRSLKQARNGMILSALCGAAGLWVSALSTAMALATVGVGSLASVFLMRNAAKKSGCVFHPELWRTWALWGAGGSVFLYLAETFPDGMGMRLEVNHPLYAVGWLGGGWIIAILSEWVVSLGSKGNPFPWRKLIVPVILCAILPALVIFGGVVFYRAIDPFLLRLNKMIAEALPLLVRIQTGGLTWKIAFGWFPLFLLASFVLCLMRRVDGGTKAVLTLLSVPILLITALQFYQVRWGMMGSPVYIALAGVVIPQVWRLVPRRAFPRAAGVVLLVATGYVFVQPTFQNTFSGCWEQFRHGTKGIPISYAQGLALLHRQMARAILDSAGDKPVVLLSSPNSSCMLSGLGGFRTVGTLYWENVEGLKKAAAALNAQSDDEALDRIRKLGVTHVSLMTWENFIEPFFRIMYPDRMPGKSVENSFGWRALQNKMIPQWTRPLLFPPTELTKRLQQQVLLLQVVPDQTAEEARYHVARFARFVENNPAAAEITLRQILDAAPKSSLVRLELADLYFAQKRYQGAVDHLIQVLPDGDAAQRSQLAQKYLPVLTSAGEWKLRADLLRSLAEAKDADADALVLAVWMLSTAPDPAGRDAGSALKYCDRLEAMPHSDAQILLSRAAALGAAGDFKAAAESAQKVATVAADQKQRDLAAAMAESFGSGKMWVEGN